MQIERATHVDDELVAAFARLTPQLNPTATVPSRAHLVEMTSSPSTHLLLARDPAIVGTLTLSVFRVPTGLIGQINNVVVDEAARGRGVGEALMREAIAIGRTVGVARVQLTSRAVRAVANRLYQRLGFELHATNAYRMTM